MNTIDLTHDICIAQPAEQVWSVIADYSRDTEWRTGVTEMVPSPPGPVLVGTTTAETLRLGGKTWHNDGEVTAVVPGQRFAWRTTTGADAHGSRAVEALGDSECRVRLDLHVRPRGFERLLAPMLRRMLDRNLRVDLERLSTITVSGEAASSSPHGAKVP